MDGPGVGTTFQLEDLNNIGTAKQCNIQIDSAQLSAQQAEIKFKGRNYVITATSTETITVNGKSIEQEHSLVQIFRRRSASTKLYVCL